MRYKKRDEDIIRFIVSVPKKIGERIIQVAETMGVSRTSLFEAAIQEYLYNEGLMSGAELLAESTARLRKLEAKLEKIRKIVDTDVDDAETIRKIVVGED